MLSSISLGFKQLGDSRSLIILLLGIAFALAVSGLLIYFAGWVTDWLVDSTAGGEGFWASALSIMSKLVAWFGSFFLAMLMFPILMSVVIVLFVDAVAGRVERQYYPNLPPEDAPGMMAILWIALKFLGISIVLNILLLFLWLLGPVYFIGYYLVNGYLVSREYFEVAALRRLDFNTSRRLRKKHQMALIIWGIVIVVMLNIPVLNLLMPIVATAAAVHLVVRWQDKDGLIAMGTPRGQVAEK